MKSHHSLMHVASFGDARGQTFQGDKPSAAHPQLKIHLERSRRGTRSAMRSTESASYSTSQASTCTDTPIRPPAKGEGQRKAASQRRHHQLEFERVMGGYLVSHCCWMAQEPLANHMLCWQRLCSTASNGTQEPRSTKEQSTQACRLPFFGLVLHQPPVR